MTIFFFWIVLVSGIWLFIFFQTSVTGAYQSVEYLTHQQWLLGGVMRSLHRYASDAAIITLVLHIIKEFSLDRYRGRRWFNWLTGVPLIWLVIPLGITGYWLVWDQLAQFVALSSAELIDWLPVFSDSMARNFLSAESLSDRFFTLMAFVHLIALPLLLVFGIWLHVFRLNGPRVNPPRELMAGALLIMLVLSVLHPALSQPQANLARVPQSVGLDWYYLLVYPLLAAWPPGWVWALLATITLLLALAPWLPPAPKEAVATVDLDNCNGCRRCVDDCPFGAVSLFPRSDGKAYDYQAVVDPDLCLSCGICVGACPTATPFRSRGGLVPGIDLPALPAAELRRALQQLTRITDQKPAVLVVGCSGSKGLKELRAAGAAVLDTVCIAHLPPPFIDYVLSRDLADGVFLAGCPAGDCRYRSGARWTEQRIARVRDPRLRTRVDQSRIALAWQTPWSSHARLGEALAAFRDRLNDSKTGAADKVESAARPGRWFRALSAVVAGSLFALLVGWFSNAPSLELIEADTAMISVTFSHAGALVSPCRTLNREELEKLPANMRNPTDCPRERHPIDVELRFDGAIAYQASLAPSGIWRDGESIAYRRLPIPAGERLLFIGLRDSGRAAGFDYQREVKVALEAGQNLVVEFDPLNRDFVFR